MKICFFANVPYYGGLNNNGGSRTILKSCEELDRQGHKTCVVAFSDKFRFFPHPKPVKTIPKNWDYYIAVSILDLHEMLKHVPAKKAAVWIRGVETWRCSFSKLKRIVDKAKSKGVKIFVNSTHLQAKYGGEILYPGYDPIWHPKTREYDKTTIGVLKHVKRSKGYHFFKEVKRELGGNYDWRIVGVHTVDDAGMARIYHRCDIWFAPTSLEGLHCPPMEAALCGALVVCSNHPDNGMVPDYATERTAMIYEHGNLESAVKAIKDAHFSKNIEMIKKIKTDIGTREKNMRRLISLLGG